MRQYYRYGRRLAAIVTVGMMFQAGGCAIDGQVLAATLVRSLVENLVGTWVFSSFNLIP